MLLLFTLYTWEHQGCSFLSELRPARSISSTERMLEAMTELEGWGARDSQSTSVCDMAKDGS